MGDVGKSKTVIAGVASNCHKGLFHVEAEAFGQHSLGLFDRDPTVQGALKLYVEYSGRKRCSVLKDGNRGHVGKCLGDKNICIVHLSLIGPEQVKSANRLSSEVHGKACTE